MSWIICNAAGFRWGPEEFETKEAAQMELQSFYADKKGQVDLAKFRIEEEDEKHGREEHSTVH